MTPLENDIIGKFNNCIQDGDNITLQVQYNINYPKFTTIMNIWLRYQQI